MRLITHNMLTCHVKNCEDPDKQFPLRFKDAKLEQIEAERNDEFLVRMLPRLDWAALLITANELNIALPEKVPAQPENDDAFLQALHTAILETHVQEGSMVCNGCGHEYKITKGIPNMLLAEHEI
ncbi:hypothetical protein LPJ63_002151 [Coemansia sp. RSA 2711]|nr:hypothetical protein LPJ63_002151 [Coemansia sp. RSA 2711]KAJ1845844.1 hypothetical protein LPJ70_002324 [Coemansia sp. RSA 2708]KAJ2311118.1 hypothetical protein IWW54_002816 [Coemansia sp. RSA 2705]KAJ2319297.1 hypothetical protein IWW52_002054 [Coemansia sp. RSA 2704]KAJ2365956.1 hypothetical protein H4S01_002970 [Coemansia sp. RSA 2610]KAJ2384548.1 hypothetical protein H4S02_004762 [Coemansia sp. RSA 2611]KAJ2738838.1 hypothetical protein H4R23_000878 [Coemansia sp. Cherry 401B]